jgi:hypothetical protein
MISDTTPEAARVRWLVLAALSGEQRLRQALELTDFVLRVHADGRRARGQRSLGVEFARLRSPELPTA